MIRHLLFSGDISKLIICVLFFLYFIFLIFLYKKFKDDSKKNDIWKILCLVPFVVSVIHFFVFTRGWAFKHLFLVYKYIYILSILILLLPILLMKKNKKVIKIFGIIVIVVFSLISFVSYMDSSVDVNFTNRDMKDAYISLCNYFEKNYIMNEWKKIEYEKIKEDGLKLVDEAVLTGDLTKYYEALYNFVYSFYDGHIGLSWYKNDVKEYIEDKIKGFNDYGLSLITLDDGTTIAVDVDDSLKIKNGDIITKWNGVSIRDAIKNVNNPIPENIIENNNIMKTFWLAGVGGDKVDVTYINSNNKEKTVTLDKLDSNLPRALKSRRIFFNSVDEGYSYKMLTNSIGYLKIVEEETNKFNDYIGYLTGNHKFAREMYRKDLRELRKKGMTRLIIDIRNNVGGYDDVATALTSLFTKDKMFAYSLGIKDGKKYKSVSDRYVVGDGEFSDIEVVVLTNMRCGSAGDGMVSYLSKLENVKIVGLSYPAGMNQETGGQIFMPEGVVIEFPIGIVLDENGNPNIDIDYTRKSRTPLDIKIPLTKESVLKIFDEEDYELEWVIEYFHKK